MPRVQLNTRAPAFSLPDHEGQVVSLSDYLDRQNVLVVFNRGFV